MRLQTLVHTSGTRAGSSQRTRVLFTVSSVSFFLAACGAIVALRTPDATSDSTSLPAHTKTVEPLPQRTPNAAQVPDSTTKQGGAVQQNKTGTSSGSVTINGETEAIPPSGNYSRSVTSNGGHTEVKIDSDSSSSSSSSSTSRSSNNINVQVQSSSHSTD